MYQADVPYEPEVYVDGLPSSMIEARAKKDGVSFDEALRKLSEEYSVRGDDNAK